MKSVRFFARFKYRSIDFEVVTLPTIVGFVLVQAVYKGIPISIKVGSFKNFQNLSIGGYLERQAKRHFYNAVVRAYEYEKL